ncbi:ALF repeat-containing protein, partial [Streptomyces anulatus]|uniref:ALF repeat-containing protein n=1 Tax=Streptomyces anulatus TaxID=1892 RepID=UPI0036AC83F1
GGPPPPRGAAPARAPRGGGPARPGPRGEKAAAAAAKAKRLADQATRAAKATQINANQAATAARQSRDAANDAAAHARAAAKAADKAADEAGKAVDAAAASTAAANAATVSADNALKAAQQALTVVDLARKTDAERLAQQQDEEVLAAEEANRAHEARTAAAEWQVGRVQELTARTRTLLDEAKAASDPAITATKGRQAAVNMLNSSGTWARSAAEAALSGTDAGVAEFVHTTLAVALEQDDRASVAHIAATSEIPAQQQAALDTVDAPIEQVREFLRTRAYPGKGDDDRVTVAKLLAEGGPGVKAAAGAALDGTDADVARFLETGQYTAREDDDRVLVSKALSTGGPEVKAAAQAVLSGPPTRLRPFLEIGLHKARQRDANAGAHIAEVNTLLQAAYKSAHLAQKDAHLAQKAAAEARKNAADAVKWANKAADSAKDADGYAKQANASANEAAASSEKAAESARTARNAAAAAQKDAQSAARSAERAQHSVGVAGNYAYQAGISAYQAGISAEAAGKDAVAAAKAETEAMKIAATKLIAELQEQIRAEMKDPSKPLSDDEMRKAVQKRFVEFRQGLLENKELRPGDTVLICVADGGGGMGCSESSYIDQMVAWYIGADEIENCLANKSLSCVDDLILSALKLKILKKLPCNGKGARVMMGGARTVAVQAAADKCPNGRLSDKLPKGMSQEIAEGYDLYKQGRLVSHDTYRGNEWPKWAGAKEYAVPGAPNNQRILVKTLPNGVEMIGWTSTHYKKIQRFTAPHFPDWGWKK